MKKLLPKIIIIVVVILAVVLIGGFRYLYNHGLSGQYANTEAREGQIKVACVGDSITYGHGITDWEKNNYPAVLQELLGDGYHVMNFGSSGACVNPDGDQPYTSRDVYQQSIAYDADVLVFMLGTNDSKPENWTNAADFMEDYKALLSTYLESENLKQVYICYSAETYWMEETDSSLAEYDIQPAIVDEIVEEVALYAAASEYEFHAIDIHSLTTEHPEWFAKDGIHPNNDGAKAIAEMVAEAIYSNQ